MLIFNRFILSVGLILMTGMTPLYAMVIEDFQQDSKWKIMGGTKLEGSCEVVDSPMRQGKSLQVNWGVPRDKYFEVFVASERPVVQGFEKSAKPFHATVSWDVFSPGTAELHRMAIRLIDSDGETFQWSSAVEMKEEGWHTVTIPISPDNYIVSWGGKPESKGKFDGQVRFVSLTFDFDSRITPADEAVKRRIFFDNITLKLPQIKAASAASPQTSSAAINALTIENFELGHQWKVYKPHDFHANSKVSDSPERQGKSLQVHWDLPRAKYFETYSKQKIQIEDFERTAKPYHATATVDVYSPGTSEPSHISLRLRDSEQETFQWSSRVDLSKEGWQTITFDIRPDNAKGSWGGKQENPGKLDGKIYLSGIAIGFNGQIKASDDPAKRRLFIDNVIFNLPAPKQVSSTTRKALQSKNNVVLGSANLKAILVGLNTGHPMHIVDPISPQPAYMTLTNTAAKTQQVVLDINASSFLGRTYKLTQTVILPGRETVDHFLPLPQDQQDFWWIYYTLSDPNSAQQESGRELLGVMTPTGNNPTFQPKDRFLFGMCAHSARYDDATMQAEAYAAGLIGIDVIRTGVSWGSLQPDPNTWKWSKMDREVELYRQQNIEQQYIFAFTPRWATTGDASAKDWLVWSRAAPQMEPWKNYIDQVTKRYHNDIRYWELWNEPDLGFFRGTPEEYIQMCKAAYPILKRNAPNAIMLSGGWSAANRNPGFIETAMSQTADTYDILAIHAHGFFGSFQKIVDERWSQLRSQYAKDKPIYFNETGLSSPGDTVQADMQQAVELVRKVGFTMGRGAMAYNWYDLRHDGDNPNDHEHRYGMITRDFQAKPAYMAYNNLIGTLRGYRFIKQLNAAADQWLFLFQKDQQYVLLGWAQQPYAVGQIVLHSDSLNINHVDMLGNKQILPRLSDGSVVVALEAQPAYWVFDQSAKQPSLTNSLIKLPGVAAWIPGEGNELKFNFTNPLENKADFTFRVQMPRSLGGALLQSDKTISAGQSIAIAIPVGVIRGSVDYTRPFHCILEYQDKNYQIKGSCQLPIQWAGVIRKGGFDALPTFTIDQREQTFNRYRADPNNTHRVWKGPLDLSAMTWLTASDTHLKIRMKVKDDKHVQKNVISELWKSDCIQLAMQLPGQKGIWEINIACGEDGQSLIHPGIVPEGIDASAINASVLKATVTKGQVIYELLLPLSALQLTSEQLKQGIYLSMLVNDDDGLGRDGWIALSSGIGSGKDPSCYPLFIAR